MYMSGQLARMHDPPLRKPMLFWNVAPVASWSRMKPLPSELCAEMSMFSNETVRWMMFVVWSPKVWYSDTPLENDGSMLPLWATIDSSMNSPCAQYIVMPLMPLLSATSLMNCQFEFDIVAQAASVQPLPKPLAEKFCETMPMTLTYSASEPPNPTPPIPPPSRIGSSPG